MFLTTLTFLFSTPGWGAQSRRLPGALGAAVLKDLVLLGAAVWSLGESLRAIDG